MSAVVCSLSAVETFGGENANTHKKKNFAQGRCSWRVLPGLRNFSNQICSGRREENMTWTCVRFFTIFHKLRASCGRPQFRLYHLSPGPSPPAPLSITSSPPSPLSKPPPGSRLRVLLFVSCVMSIYLSIDLSISPRLLLASSDIPLLYLSPPHHNVTSTGWRRWCARSPNALASGRPPRVPSPLSPTSSPSFSLRLRGCLSSFSS